jgi:predicted nucleotide-binding protein
MARVVLPYEVDDPITLSGTTYIPSQVDQIEIAITQVPLKVLGEAKQAEQKRQRISSPLHFAESYAFTDAKQVTDELIRGEPGHKKRQAISVSTNEINVDRSRVFVVHGRDLRARDGLFAFLRSLGLDPIEWDEAKSETGKGSPYTGEILEAGFAMAQAAIVMLTPDDSAMLREPFWKDDDPYFEHELMGQARPNVLYEAGLAMGRFPDRTILVQMGKTRPLSDLDGRHFVRLDNGAKSRQKLISALKTVGCDFSIDG